MPAIDNNRQRTLCAKSPEAVQRPGDFRGEFRIVQGGSVAARCEYGWWRGEFEVTLRKEKIIKNEYNLKFGIVD